MIKFEQFYPWLMVNVADCPSIVIDAALRDAAREYCDKTLVWFDDCVVELVPEQLIYDLPPQCAGQLIKHQLCGDVHHVDAVSANLLRLNQLTTSGEVNIRRYWIPTTAAMTLPNLLYEDPSHQRGIIAYTLYRLHTMANQAWTNPQMAAAYLIEYSQRLREARTDTNRQHKPSSLHVSSYPLIP